MNGTEGSTDILNYKPKAINEIMFQFCSVSENKQINNIHYQGAYTGLPCN